MIDFFKCGTWIIKVYLPSIKISSIASPMTYRRINSWLFIGGACFASVTASFAQTPVGADGDWQKLGARLSAQPSAVAAPIVTVQGKPAVPGPASAKNPVVENFVQTAKDAKAFYTKYPADARAKEARKIEALATMQSAYHGAIQYRIDGLKLGDAIRADKAMSAHDRFDVALAMEMLRVQSVNQDKRLIDNGVLAEQIGDRFFAEFGWSAEVAGYFHNVMITGDKETALRVAGKVQRLNIPAAEKADAEAVVRHYGRFGKPVAELVMLDSDGSRIDFSAVKQTTVVYFWSTAGGTEDLALLNRFKTSLPIGTRWIYVGLGGSPKNLKEVTAAAPFAGQFCFDAASLGGAAATTLGVRQTPAVVVLAKGVLSAVGDLETLPSLLNAASR